MATSGSSYSAFARHRLVCSWSVNRQDIAGNYTIVTGFLHLRSMDAYGAIYGSAVTAAEVTVNGARQTENATVQLSANQNKLLLAKDYRVNHDADGRKTFPITGSFPMNITFAGAWIGTAGVPVFNGTLNTIPRHSSLNPVPTFTPPAGCSFSISRNSTFTHNLSFWIQNRKSPTLSDDSHWTWIMEVKNVATSGTFNFSDAQISTIAARLGQFNENIQGKVKLWTNGVSGLSAQRTVSIVNPAAVQPDSNTLLLKAGQALNITLNNYSNNAKFTYDVTFNCAGYTKTWSNTRLSKISYSLTQADVNGILSRFTGSVSNGYSVTVTSKLQGQRYRTARSVSKTANVDKDSARPTATNAFSHADINATSTAVTGDNKILIQGVSNLRVTIPSSIFAARSYGILRTVAVAFGGVTKTVNYASGNMVVDFGVITTGASGSITATVTDSRGLQASGNYAITVWPYTAPTIDFQVTRRNNFESTTFITGTSLYTSLTNKNIVMKASYQLAGGMETALPVKTNTEGKLVINDFSLEINNDIAINITFKITDKLKTTTRTYTIPKGKPIMFINSKRKTVSIGDLGRAQNESLPGLLEIEGEHYHSTGLTGIQMNNSDISGVNGIWFSTDPSDNNGEGLHFLRSGAEAHTTEMNLRYYDYMYMRNGAMYVNSDTNPVFEFTSYGTLQQKELWTGGWWMNGNQIATPSKPLANCRNGWILNFVKYVNSTTTITADVGTVYIPKSLLFVAAERGIRAVYGGFGDVVEQKYLNITNTQIKGNAVNGNTIGKVSIMTKVYEW